MTDPDPLACSFCGQHHAVEPCPPPIPVKRWESEDIKQAACCNENEAHIEAALAYIREIEESGSIRIEIERVVRALKGKGEGKKR